ncbi:MAG: RNA 3'-terminal phosphate cyclase, partial [Nitrospinaceae bacterium]|nr:RNA 3'-terminal phosphate cyclase [Nitrospinaceae bacterium]NIR54917.1 RNA 3'-terminal phosphate cyclase [Nitrospinaceae bacterium]NIS85345.1 RNA 3'-terminal phosphate cyclase [Nitrospinaceae bacterium]NIT82159.1 RNA 3'-terminal phosphate cyclase [Nitrospinaceae bacterium]NIU44413.1 RNA 3'-terminal phosphate cyclase [Nitrospinaceae bacterium]
SPGPGNMVAVTIESEHITEMFTAFGRRGVPAEQVAGDACKQAHAYLDAGVPVGVHLADQLLLPMALAGGGRFKTLKPDPHTTTNIRVIQEFLDVRFEVKQETESRWEIIVKH